jgi:hypothetical protein
MTPDKAAGDRALVRLLTRLFLRRLIDHDVISPHADRHESLALLYALTVSFAVFVTFFLSVTYLSAFIQLPGPAAMSALSDRFLFIAASITTSALGALMVWDALSLEPRDAAILGPLPISTRTISAAKLAAAVIFGAVLTIALNAVPSVLYPAFLTLNIGGTRVAGLLQLIAVHAATVTMAGLFGFFAILAVRGAVRLLLGESGFRRASSGLQSALVVSMVTALLLAPTVRAADVRQWIGVPVDARWPARPVLWFLGVNETLGGHVVAETPIVPPPRYTFVDIPTSEDRAARVAYRALLPRLAALGRQAWLSLPLVSGLALATFLWTNRRLPERSAGVPAASRIRTIARRTAERCTERDPEAQAGLFFALQTLTRSAAHRTVLAIAVAVGLTHALMVLAQSGRQVFEMQLPPSNVFAIGIMSLLALLIGIAYAVRVPAAPAANWIIRMTWCGDERRYTAGVKRAAMLLVAVLLALLLPLHLALFGTRIAVMHSLFGLVLAAAALDALFLFTRALPFACTYVPIENPKIVWPAGFVGLVLVTYQFARAERWGMETPGHALACAFALAAIALAVKTIDRLRRQKRPPINFDGRPASTTQRLGLFEHVTMGD